MARLTCEEFRHSSAELALGILDARQRSLLLEHARGCPVCWRELLDFDEVSDRLLDLSPPVEPPAGFETRVLARLGHPVGQPGAQERRWSRMVQLPAAVTIAVALAMGGFALGRSGGAGSSTGGRVHVGVPGTLRTAQLWAGTEPAGRAVASVGPDPWIAMAVSLPSGDRWVTCSLRIRGGRTVRVGSFQLSGGYGYWATALPVAASSVVGAQLASSGRIVARATFRL